MVSCMNGIRPAGAALALAFGSAGVTLAAGPAPAPPDRSGGPGRPAVSVQCRPDSPAARALDLLLRGYESGDLNLLQQRLAPDLPGLGFVLDGVARQRLAPQTRLTITERQMQCGPDVTVIDFAWEKRWLDGSALTPRLAQGRSAVLISGLGQGLDGPWRLSGLVGDNPFAAPVAAAPPAPGRMLAADPDEGRRARGMVRAESALDTVGEDAEGYAAAKVAAPPAPLRDRAEADGAKGISKDDEKLKEPISTLAYLCKDTASGLAEVRRLVLAAGGTLVERKERLEQGDSTRNAVLASVPADRLKWLAARLKQAAEQDSNKALVPAYGTAGSPAEAEAFGTGGAGRGGAGKPPAITVRIVLKVEPKPQD